MDADFCFKTCLKFVPPYGAIRRPASSAVNRDPVTVNRD